MTRQPYSSAIERAYDRYSAWHARKVERQVKDRYRRLDERDQAYISGQRKAGPSIWAMMLCLGLAYAVSIGTASALDAAFGLENGLIAAISVVGGVMIWMVLLLVLTVRKIHRQNAAGVVSSEK